MDTKRLARFIKEMAAEQNKVSKPTQETDASVQEHEKKRASNPHSVLHEVLVAHHINRLLGNNHRVISDDKINELKNSVNEASKRSKRPSVESVEQRAKKDAEEIHNQLSQAHGFSETTRAHWTPHNTARRRIPGHENITHSGDIVVTGLRRNKQPDGTESPGSAGIDLKYGKSTSIRPPKLEEVSRQLPRFIRGFKGTSEKLLDILRTNPPKDTKARSELFGSIGEQHAAAFNSLGKEEQRGFVRSLWGGSSHKNILTSYRFHSKEDGPGSLTNVDKDFDDKFSKGTFSAATPGIKRKGKFLRLRGFNILHNGKRILTLGIKHQNLSKWQRSGNKGTATVSYNTKIANV